MTTQVYEKVFLVNNILAISGIFEAQDIIKRYVLTDNWHMEKAYEFAEKFKYVNETIRRAISRNTSNWQYSDIMANQFWEFGFDFDNKYGVEKLYIYGSNCYVCGEYTRKESNIPSCICHHNEYGYGYHNFHDDDDDDTNYDVDEYYEDYEDYIYNDNSDVAR